MSETQGFQVGFGLSPFCLSPPSLGVRQTMEEVGHEGPRKQQQLGKDPPPKSPWLGEEVGSQQ